ncbi:MAG: hypothetical protein AAFX93_15165 [Verrucomicrobiota bacterium]
MNYPRLFSSSRFWLTLALFLPAYFAAAQPFTLSGALEIQGAASPRAADKVEICLYEASLMTPILLGKTETDGSGNFTIEVGKDFSDSIFFLTANLRPRVTYMTILGSELPAQATINELTTVAASYSMAQFLRPGQISGEGLRLQIAAMMSANIANPQTGDISDVLLQSPNADQTNSLRLTRSLGNLASQCSINAYSLSSFLQATRNLDRQLPGDLIQGLANLARNPAQDANRIYRLSQIRQPYTPALAEEPINWSIAIKINDTGGVGERQPFGGPANVSWDSQGYAFVANNVIQGGGDSSRFIVALQPDGKPSTGLNGTPPSIIDQGGILGVGWGIKVDAMDQVWIGNFGWGQRVDENYPSRTEFTGSGNGSVSTVFADGTPISPNNAYFGPFRVQGIENDDLGNIWIASFGRNQLDGINGVFVFKNGDPNDQASFLEPDGSGPFGVAPVPGGGAAWVTLSGGLAGTAATPSLARYELNDAGEIERTFLQNVGNTLKVVVADQMGNAWFSSQGNDTIYAYSPEGDQLGAFTGGGLKGPWGMAVDGEGNIWVGNFGPIQAGNDFNDTRISKFCGANPAAWPRGKTIGDPLTPETGYTLPSAGDPVLLPNGQILEGPNGEEIFTPLQRCTSVQIDRAGNLWYINNWKPNFNEDAFGEPSSGNQANPGGDGIVIWVGIAPPPVTSR